MHKVLERFDTIDRLTPALRRIKQELTKSLKQFPEYASFGCIPFETFREVLEELGFELEKADYESGKHFVRFQNHKEEIAYLVESSWYYSRVTLYKTEYDSRRNQTTQNNSNQDYYNSFNGRHNRRVS